MSDAERNVTPVDTASLRAHIMAILEHEERVAACVARLDFRSAGIADSERTDARIYLRAFACDPAPLLPLLDRLERAEADSRRLDWMESITEDVEQSIFPPGTHGGSVGNWLYVHELQAAPFVIEWEGPTLRAAIDFARSSQGETKP